MPPRPAVGTRSAWRGDDPDTLMVEGMVPRANAPAGLNPLHSAPSPVAR